MPIKAEMEILGFDDYVKILTETQHNLLEQNVELLRVEGVEVCFDQKSIEKIARIAVELNEEDNIGARRLRTVLDAVLEEINFTAPDLEKKEGTYVINEEYVTEKTKHLYQN